jgi:hypothetical protein
LEGWRRQVAQFGRVVVGGYRPEVQLPTGAEFFNVEDIMSQKDFQARLDNGWPVAVLSDYVRLVSVSCCALHIILFCVAFCILCLALLPLRLYFWRFLHSPVVSHMHFLKLCHHFPSVS